ncbi:MAG: S8 family serine peptidase [Acholeplasmatales bacterium]|nr:S8 family serine peptidase [Acholeplasmatales bacterium]
MKKIILLVICLLTLGLSTGRGYAKELDEEKLYATISNETLYSSDSIIVAFKNKKSIEMLDYDSNYFKEVNCIKVEDLTSETKNLYLESLKGNFDFIEDEYDIRKNLDFYSFHQILKLTIDTSNDYSVIDAIRTLEKDDDILYAGPNYITSTQTIPNDTYYGDYYSHRWGQEKIELPSAWDYIQTNRKILIGVMDTGISSTHEDLSANVYSSLHRDFSTGGSVSISNPTDVDGHGTHVSGIIAAVGNNNKGIAGSCWGAYLVLLKVFDNNGSGTTSYDIKAIDYATANNISLLNYSGGSEDPDTGYQLAIGNYPGLLVCAAGNIDPDIGNVPEYPAYYKAKNTIVVGNSTSSDQKASDSKYGSYVDLFAPGDGIYSTIPSNSYGFKSGTSMATPFVTGTAALMLSVKPEAKPEEIKELIMNNVDYVSALASYCVSQGRLNAYKALRAAAKPRTFTGDVNGDGYDDLIMSCNNNGTRSLTTLLGTSTGAFSSPIVTNFSNNFFYDDPAFVGDFNGDGRTDVLIHWCNGNYRQLLIYKGKSNGTFETGVNLSSTRYHDPIAYPCKFLVADQNGDGKDDFIVFYENSSYNRGALVYKGKSASPYITDATTTALSSTYSYKHNDSVFAGDFNGDGKSDLLVHTTRTSSGTVYRRLHIYIATSSGYNEATQLNSSRTYYPYTNPSKFYVSDVNGDGKDDFVVMFKQYGAYIYALTYLGKSSSPYINDASSTYSLSSTDIYNENDCVFMGDVNNDGKSDLIIHNNNYSYRKLSAYYGSSTGSFSSAVVLNSSQYIPDYNDYSDCYVMDVNGDGYCDLVAKRSNSGGTLDLLVYKGSSSGFIEATITYTNLNYYG